MVRSGTLGAKMLIAGSHLIAAMDRPVSLTRRTDVNTHVKGSQLRSRRVFRCGVHSLPYQNDDKLEHDDLFSEVLFLAKQAIRVTSAKSDVTCLSNPGGHLKCDVTISPRNTPISVIFVTGGLLNWGWMNNWRHKESRVKFRFNWAKGEAITEPDLQSALDATIAFIKTLAAERKHRDNAVELPTTSYRATLEAKKYAEQIKDDIFTRFVEQMQNLFAGPANSQEYADMINSDIENLVREVKQRVGDKVGERVDSELSRTRNEMDYDNETPLRRGGSRITDSEGDSEEADESLQRQNGCLNIDIQEILEKPIAEEVMFDILDDQSIQILEMYLIGFLFRDDTAGSGPIQQEMNQTIQFLKFVEKFRQVWTWRNTARIDRPDFNLSNFKKDVQDLKSFHGLQSVQELLVKLIGKSATGNSKAYGAPEYQPDQFVKNMQSLIAALENVATQAQTDISNQPRDSEAKLLARNIHKMTPGGVQMEGAKFMQDGNRGAFTFPSTTAPVDFLLQDFDKFLPELRLRTHLKIIAEALRNPVRLREDPHALTSTVLLLHLNRIRFLADVTDKDVKEYIRTSRETHHTVKKKANLHLNKEEYLQSLKPSHEIYQLVKDDSKDDETIKIADEIWKGYESHAPLLDYQKTPGTASGELIDQVISKTKEAENDRKPHLFLR